MPADKYPIVDLDEIARLLERHEGPADARSSPAPGPSRSGLRLTGAVAAGALVAGSGLGFGLGSSLTSPDNAQASFAGSGFLPARGWSVVQSGKGDARGATRAIAANVVLRPEDSARDIPSSTIASLPARGAVIVATFTTRGDSGADAAFPVRTLPLRIADAERVRPDEYRIRAGIRGTNVDARVYFGATEPSADVFAGAEGQLGRLVVGAEQVTIFARPTIVEARDPWTTLFGTVDNAKADETVTIQAKDCRSEFFRVVDGATTKQGGGWSTRYSPGISTMLRAVWNERASNEVLVRQRAGVYLRRLGRTRFKVAASSNPRGGMAGGVVTTFWRKRVLFQRFDRRLGAWKTVKQVTLTQKSVSGTVFRVSLPKGTLVRAVLSLSQARPCYLGGTSLTLRT